MLTAALLPLYARGSLPRWARRIVRERLQSSSSWRRHYEVLRRSEPSTAALSAMQMRVVLLNILDDVAPSSRAMTAVRPAVSWMTVLLAAAVTATVFFSAAVDGTTPPTPARHDRVVVVSCSTSA